MSLWQWTQVQAVSRALNDLLLFGLASFLASTQTAGVGLMLFVLALLLFIGGSGTLHYEACYKILEKTLTPSNVISFRNNMEQFARYLLGILAHSQESPT
jgi:hypothetical protein